MKKYVIWSVYENEGLITKFYVVNNSTKEVQSVWNNYLEARATCDKLNTVTKKQKGA